uniref:sensor histidine kinase n=1 Tax=Allorhizocola rhizosphaerae TaxID=1872709 RepID=UPI001FEB9BCD
MVGTRVLPVWAVVMAGVLLAVIAASYGETAWWAWAAALGLSLAALLSLIRYRIIALLIATALSLGAGLAMTQAVPPWSIAVCGIAAVVSTVAGRRMPQALPAIAVFAAGIAGAAALTAVDGYAWINGLITLALGVVIPWLGGRYLRQQVELADAQAEQARIRERARIAHDMHDSIGHELSLLALRAAALELDPALPPGQRVAAGELRAGAAAVIARLADIVSVMRRGEPAPLEPSIGGIADLVGQSQDAGMEVLLILDGLTDLPSTVDRAVHRVVQEGLTNAAKHAPGARVEVRVRQGPDATTVTVSSGPARFTPRAAAGARTGLIALRERVEAAGGTLRAG